MFVCHWLGCFLFFATRLMVDGADLSARRTKSFAGHKVLSILPRDNKTLLWLNSLMHEGSRPKIDFWTFPTVTGRPVDVRVNWKGYRFLRLQCSKRQIQCTTMLSDVQKAIERSSTSFALRSGGFDTKYHNYSEIVDELRRLASTYPKSSELIYLGKSYWRRKMYAIKIAAENSSAEGSSGSKTPIVFLNCGVHAREWISPATCMYIARQLLIKSARDAKTRDAITKTHWVILPVFNVDGYWYSHKRNRLWRKNRSKHSSGCRGVDLNRNFNHEWASVGAAPDSPCSSIYPGTEPFSEVESYNVAKYLLSIRSQLKGYIDFHAYGQLWMSPWGHSVYNTPSFEIQLQAMEKIVAAIKSVYGTTYQTGPASIVIYPTSGASVDWVYGILGVVHSYGVELRPSHGVRAGGFLLSPQYIVPTGRETYAGVLALGEFINNA